MSNDTTTRTMRFEVTFPNMRNADRLKLYQKLWAAQKDLRKAMNLAIYTTFQCRLGLLEKPLKKDGTAYSDTNLPYMLLNGSWQPLGRPVYVPSMPEAKITSSPTVEASALINSRINTDWKDLMRGDKSLSTFRNAPLGASASTVFLTENHTFSLPLLSSGRTIVRPRKLDGSRKAILNRIVSKEYKLGACKFFWDQPPKRKGKWYLAISYTMPAKSVVTSENRVMGIDIGRTNTIYAALINQDGTWERNKIRVQLPSTSQRAWDRHTKEKNSRASLAETRQSSKFRMTAAGERLQNSVNTSLKAVVSRIFREAERHGVMKIAVENLSWSTNKMLDTSIEGVGDGETNTRRKAAVVRRIYFKWHQGALRALIAQKAELLGYAFEAVPAQYTSKTCPSCDKMYPKMFGAFGRISWDQFKCECGFEAPADWAAAINVGRRGLTVVSTPKAPKVRPAGRRKIVAATVDTKPASA